MGRDKVKQSLVFDPKEREDFVRGFAKRKQERREIAKQKAVQKEKEIRKVLRQKRKEAKEKLEQSRPDMHSGNDDETGLDG